MDIDDYLQQLRNDLDSRLSGTNDNRPLNNDDIISEKESLEEKIYCPECGQKIPADSVFCPKCGVKIGANDGDYEDFNIDDYDDSYGIILTDTKILAEKYNQQQEKAKELLNEYISQANERGNTWFLLDTDQYRSKIDDNNWLEYNRIIDIFIEENNISTGPFLSLFIIGGNDIIPIPYQNNPQGGEKIPCDMSYSFSGDFLNDIISKGALPNFSISETRCSVGRLPLEDGKISDKSNAIYDDLQSYFNITGVYAQEGIPVKSVLMTSHADWAPASATMSEHLPLEAVNKESPYVKDGMFISPDTLTSNEDSLEEYIPSLEDADLLMFNLHGSDAPGYSGFYSSDEAFCPALLKHSNARVLNTVACFGARYHGYSREDSMLLSAIYGGGILLYTGSLISVPMLQDNEARELLMNPGTGSEVFMRLYTLYQFKGENAGIALLHAKCDYFNLCRHIEEDAFTLATTMMFSLYGNPMLKMSRKDEVINSARQNDLTPISPVKADNTPLKLKKFKRVMSKDSSTRNQGLLAQVRGLVDRNLQDIRDIVTEHLYNSLGLQPRDLKAIDEFDSADEKGYCFRYLRSDSKFGRDVWADADSQGNVKRIYTTKNGKRNTYRN